MLLILAGISINLIMGNDGIIEKSEIAATETEKEIATEQMDFKINSAIIDSYEINNRKPTLQELADFLCKNEENDIEYVYVKSKDKAEALPQVTVAPDDIIIAKLCEYPYEYEIDGTLAIVNVELANSKDESDSNGLIQESTLIGDFTIVTEKVSTSSITINLAEGTSLENVIGYIVFIGTDAIDVTNKMPYKISGLEKVTTYEDIYVMAIDNKGNGKKSSNKLTETTTNMIDEGLVDYWMFNGNTDNEIESGAKFVTYQGSPEFRDNELYLSNSILATEQNYVLNSKYTIIFENKNIIAQNGANEHGAMVGFGFGGSGVGSSFLGFDLVRGLNSWQVMSGAGDSYTISMANNETNYAKDIWHTFAITYKEGTFSYFVDSKKIGSSSKSEIKNSKLYVGGFSNAGSSGAGAYWGYGTGYYRNLAIYNRALTDEEIMNFEF